MNILSQYVERIKKRSCRFTIDQPLKRQLPNLFQMLFFRIKIGNNRQYNITDKHCNNGVPVQALCAIGVAQRKLTLPVKLIEKDKGEHHGKCGKNNIGDDIFWGIDNVFFLFSQEEDNDTEWHNNKLCKSCNRANNHNSLHIIAKGHWNDNSKCRCEDKRI